MPQVLLVVDEQRTVRVVGSLQVGKRDRLVERIEFLDRLRSLQLLDLQSRHHVLERLLAGLGPDQDAGVVVGAADAAGGDVGGAPQEIGALIAAFERRAVEVADRLLQEGDATCSS